MNVVLPYELRPILGVGDEVTFCGYSQMVLVVERYGTTKRTGKGERISIPNAVVVRNVTVKTPPELG